MNIEEIQDKRIAVLLSGGVDSSVVVYEFAKLGLHPDCFYSFIISAAKIHHYYETAKLSGDFKFNNYLQLNGIHILHERG